MNIVQKYEKQITKARINPATAMQIAKNVKSPEELFPVIDRVFMKAKFSGMTTDQIVTILVSGAFSNESVDETKLAKLRPYLDLWPQEPEKAHLAFKAGLQPDEIRQMGTDSISLESLKVMASLS